MSDETFETIETIISPTETEISVSEIPTTGNTHIPVVADILDDSDSSIVTSDNDAIEQDNAPKMKSKRGGKRAGAGRKKPEQSNAPPIDNPIENIAESINAENLPPVQEFDAAQYETIVVKADTEEKKEYKAFLTGMMLLMVMNLFIPVIALKVMGAISPKFKKIDSKDIQLDDKQLLLLEECANECAGEIFKQLSPIAQLGLGFTIMTIGNIMVRAKIDEV